MTDPLDPHRPLYAVLHVPKCAGRTMERHLEAEVGADRYVRTKRMVGPGRWFARAKYRLERTHDPKQVEVVSGHFLGKSLLQPYAGREIRKTVLIRDPVGYFLSHYNFRMWRYGTQGRGGFPLSVWYGLRERNPISFFLLSTWFELPAARILSMGLADRLALIENDFRDFWFVGSYRRCDELLTRICTEAGLSTTFKSVNVAESPLVRREDLPADLIRRIEDENALDLMLFERWKDRGFAGNPAAPATGLPTRPEIAEWRHEALRPWYYARAFIGRDVLKRKARGL